MRRLLTILAIALAIAILPSVLMADQTKQKAPAKRPGVERFFKHFDTDKDGLVGADELPGPMKERFPNMLKRADKNGDGKLSPDEMKAARGAFRPQGMRGPGKGDWQKRPHGQKHRDLDKKGRPDQKINKARLDGEKPWWLSGKGKQGKKNQFPMADKKKRGKAKLAMRGRKGPGMKGKGKKPSAKQIFKKLDTDGNGQLSLAEFEKGMKKFHAMKNRKMGQRGPKMRGPRKRGPGQFANRGPGRRGPGHFARRGPGMYGPRHFAMRGGPGMRGHGQFAHRGPGKRGPGHFARRGPGMYGPRHFAKRGGPGMRGHGQFAHRGPGKRGHGHFARRDPGMYGPRHFAMRGGPGMRGPGHFARRGPGMYGPRHFAMRGGPGMRGPGQFAGRGPEMHGPGYLAMRGGPGMHGFGHFANRGPNKRDLGKVAKRGQGKRGPKFGKQDMRQPGTPPCVKGKRSGKGKCPPMPPGPRASQRGPRPSGPHGARNFNPGQFMMMANKIFDRIDTNKDGKVNAEEAAEAHKKHFARVLDKVDKDHDGSINKKEAAVALVGMVKRFHASRSDGMKGPGKSPHAKGKPKSKDKKGCPEKHKKK